MSVTDESAPSGPDGSTPASASGRPRHTARNAAIVVGVVMVALIVLLATRSTREEATSKIVGQAAPPVSGVTLDGTQFSLSEHRGEWVLVNFFATWCGPCRVEHPELVKFVAEHQGDPVQVVSVASDDQSDAIRQFFAENGGGWPVIPSDTENVAVAYGVRKVPETYLIAPSGQVVSVFFGVTQQQLDATIEAAGGMAATSGA